MKSIHFISFSIILLLGACSQEEIKAPVVRIPLIPDFIIDVSDTKAPANVTIENWTQGATTYNWSFEGGDVESSTDENPPEITYSNSGDYTITLEASDGIETKTISKTFSLGEPFSVDFDLTVSGISAPAEVTLVNNSVGATSYSWSFSGAETESSTDQNPAPVVYNQGGDYTIILEVSNGTETISTSKTISLLDPLVAAFDFSLDVNSDPAEVTIVNNSTGATSYNWTFEGADTESSTVQNPPIITYSNSGEYTITLEVSNGEETKSISQELSIGTGEIVTYENITLGGVDLQETTGSVFSTSLGNVIKSTEITSDNGSLIDIAFIGIDGGLRFFESPDAVSKWGLIEIPNATTSAFINYIELSSIEFSVDTFDNMVDDTALKDLEITNDSESFSSANLPRIVLFVNANGKKGAIKITETVSGATGSVTFDMKVQK